MTKPTLVFVPGAWHGPWSFAAQRSELESRGYPCVSISNASVGFRTPPVLSHVEDSNHVRSELRRLIDDEHKDVVLVAHSYGGTVCIEAVRGWAKGEPKGSRQLQDTGLDIPDVGLDPDGAGDASQIRQNGVLGVVFIACPLPGTGKSMGTVYHTMPLTETEPADPLHPAYINIKNPYYWFYHDVVPESAAAPYVSQILPQAAGPAFSPVVGSPCWRHVPCAYVCTRNDRAVPYADQQENIENAKKESKYPWEANTIDSGHSPLLTRPQETADAVAKYAERAVDIMASAS